MTNHQALDEKKVKKQHQSVPSHQTDQAIPFSSSPVLAPKTVLQLQRTIGNRAVNQMIQRYNLSTTTNPDGVAEEEVITANAGTGVQFTGFDSCIGVVGRKDKQMVAAHLVLFGSDDSQINPESLRAAFDGATDVTIFGDVGTWDENGFLDAVIGVLPGATQIDNGKGRYRVKWDNDKWSIA